MAVNPHGPYELGRALFPADVRYPLELLVAIPEEHRANDYLVAVRQLHHGHEVGRVTWLIGPKRKDEPVGRRRRRAIAKV